MAGPSFASRMKIHPSLLHDGLPQIPFPAHAHRSILFSLSVPAPQFRVPAGLQAGNLPRKWEKRGEAATWEAFPHAPVGGCDLPASPGGVRIRCPGRGRYNRFNHGPGHRLLLPAHAGLQLENTVNKATVYTGMTVNNLLLPPGAAASHQ